MAEEDLAPGKSSVAVNNCIRQLSYCKNDIRDTVGIWGEVSKAWKYLMAGLLTLMCLVRPQSSAGRDTDAIYQVHFPRKAGSMGMAYAPIDLLAGPDPSEDWAWQRTVLCIYRAGSDPVSLSPRDAWMGARVQKPLNLRAVLDAPLCKKEKRAL